MSKIILIPGFAVGLASPIVRRPLGTSASFTVFNAFMESGEAAVFHWGIEQQVNFFQLINPVFLFRHYEKEKKLAQSTEVLESLHQFLIKNQPEIIVAHSMGVFLLNNYLQKFALPESIKKIVWVQSDDSRQRKINLSVSVCNLYCPWDPTLLVSSIYNRCWRVGLRKIKNDQVENILFPLWRPINLHTSSIRDRRLVKFISSLI
jgi:hypothetical protein